MRVVDITAIIKEQIIVEDFTELRLIEPQRQPKQNAPEPDSWNDTQTEQIIARELFAQIDLQLGSLFQNILQSSLFVDRPIKILLHGRFGAIVLLVVEIAILVADLNMFESAHKSL